MPPIPVHIDDPITPSKPAGVTPRTEPTRTTNTDAGVTTAPNTSPYPAAQPGAAAVPAPTPFAQPQPTRTTQPATSNDGPPPPQPGAVPVHPSATSSIPPPPRAGEMPSQMNIPTPSQNLAPTHSTSTATSAASGQGPTTLNFGPVGGTVPTASSAHPSGYQQNVFAQEMSPAQRASLDAQEAEDRRGSFLEGLGGSAGGGEKGGEGDMWSQVKGWVGAAGSKAAEIEGEVWRRVNGGK